MDVLLVSLGSTAGLRAADEELAASLRRAGASVTLASAAPPREVRTMVATDLLWARAARAAAARALAAHTDAPPRAVLYSTTTAALLWPKPGAIRFDAPASANRPGRHGFWQRPLERRRLAAAPLLVPSSSGALAELREGRAGGERALVVPVPVEPSRDARIGGETASAGAAGGVEPAGSAPGAARDIAAVTYGANPAKKGIDRVLAAWRAARASGAASPRDELLIAGVTREQLAAAGIALEQHEGARALGALAPHRYRSLLRRARVFVCAARREDYGIAQLEALADGCQLVTTPSPGPYAALALARELDERLVSDDLASALHAALAAPRPGYRERAAELLGPFRRSSVDELVARELLPRLLA